MRRRAVLLAAGTLTAAISTPLSRAFAASAPTPVLDHRIETEYDGQSFTDLSSQVSQVRKLSAGTVLATFSTTSRRQAMTLISASDPSNKSSNITLNVSAGALQFSVRNNGVLLQNHFTRTMYDDGVAHTVAVTVDGTGTTFYADGRPVFTTTAANFFSKVSGLTSLNIARNVDSDHPAGEWFYTGTIKRISVYEHVLHQREVAAESERVDLADFGRLATILNANTPSTWLTTGDSITHGALWTNGWRSYPEHFQERVRWELGKPKNSDFVVDSGVSGSTTIDLVARFDERVAAFRPKVVSIMLGTNDVATAGLGLEVYRANLLKLVSAVRDLPGKAIPLLQTPNPVDPARWPGRVALADYAKVMREVAEQEQVVLIDHYAHWLADNGGSVPLALMGDGLHPNQRGHLYMAKKMIRDLRIFDPASRVCSLTIP